MNSNQEKGEERREEIIIIKRKRGDHDDHHGGAWKIAYADFVTAMMAFFLVMWLINSSNEETKTAVASYFNPIKLMDTTSNPKGVNDAQYGAQRDAEAQDDPAVRLRSDQIPVDDNSSSLKVDEQQLFADPYTLLTEIAGAASPTGAEDADSAQLETLDAQRPGMLGGEAFRDPFDPDFWEREPEIAPQPVDPEVEVSDQDLAIEEAVDEASVAALPELDAVPEALTAQEIAQDFAEKMQQQLDVDPAAEEGPSITVSAAENGDLIIDMTDGLNFEMFQIGSAAPKKAAIEAVERIANALKNKAGKISISGHTDGRPFVSDDYDNWRLSSARAQMAYYMLVRAGLSELRIDGVTGHADRMLKLPDAPLDAQNRRIEIRVKQPDIRS